MGIKTIDRIKYCMYCGNPLSAGSHTCAFCEKNTEPADPEATVSICRNCSESVPMIASFCPYCGTKTRDSNIHAAIKNPVLPTLTPEKNLWIFCPICGSRVKNTSGDCPTCGYALQDILSTSSEAKMCFRLKRIRSEVAKANHIPFETPDCPNTRDCQGICPACDQEGIWLNERLQEIEGRGKKIVWPELDPIVNYDRAIDSMIADRFSQTGFIGPTAGMPTRKEYVERTEKKTGLISKVKGLFKKS